MDFRKVSRIKQAGNNAGKEYKSFLSEEAKRDIMEAQKEAEVALKEVEDELVSRGILKSPDGRWK